MTSFGVFSHMRRQLKADSMFMRTMGAEYVTDPAALGRRLRQLRHQRGLTQGELAGGELSTAYISRIEAGQRRPEPKVVHVLAERLGTTAEFLLTGVAADDVAEARLALRYAELALHSGEPGDAEAQLRRLLADDATSRGGLRRHAQLLLARALENLGRLDDAIHELEELRTGEVDGDFLHVYLSLCRCYRESGDLARSIDVGEQGLHLAEELQLQGCDDAVRLTMTVAAAYFERGDAAYAAHLCQQALEHAEHAASAPARASTLWNSSIIASERGRTQLALTFAERALALLEEATDTRAAARLRLELGLILLAQRPADVDGADAALTRSRADLADSASAVDMARCDAALALVRLHQGNVDDARLLAEQARRGATDAPLVAARCELVLGRISAASGDAEEARNCYRAAVALLTAVAGDRSAAAVWYELAALLERVGDVDGALQAYRSAAASAGVRATTDVITATRV